MHADRRTPVVLLAVLFTLSGGLCLIAYRVMVRIGRLPHEERVLR